jgi:hypothetical protein
MADREHTKQPVEGRRPVEVEGAPSEEEIPGDVADRTDLDPDEQLNRPDQPDASREEREQYEHPVAEPVLHADRED